MTGAQAILGLQWGDEGKGKLVDCLAESCDIVVRFQGGNNAGHTLTIGSRVFKLSLLPSGVLRPGVTGLIGGGVVVDPFGLVDEIHALQQAGFSVGTHNLKIAENAVLVLPFHKVLDKNRETAASEGHKIGTTGRGIGPAYQDKVGRGALRLCDLAHPAYVRERLQALEATYPALAGTASAPTACLEALSELAPVLLSFRCVAWHFLETARQAGKRLLFEGAQGTLLDLDHGTYPFVTSSNTLLGQAHLGSGYGGPIDGIGVAKAYQTRVGNGPFPTEAPPDIAQKLGERGHEYGTVTNRPRRCGWLDLVALRQAVVLNGVRELALTKLDVLDGFEELCVCEAYELGDQVLDFLPASPVEQAALRPVYRRVPGWHVSTRSVREFEVLPSAAQAYIHLIESKAGVPIRMISTGPERNELIRRPVFSASSASGASSP